jgi:hypothetical protein
VIRRKYPEEVVYQGRDLGKKAEIEDKIEDRVTRILDVFLKWVTSR